MTAPVDFQGWNFPEIQNAKYYDSKLGYLANTGTMYILDLTVGFWSTVPGVTSDFTAADTSLKDWFDAQGGGDGLGANIIRWGGFNAGTDSITYKGDWATANAPSWTDAEWNRIWLGLVPIPTGDPDECILMRMQQFVVPADTGHMDITWDDDTEGTPRLAIFYLTNSIAEDTVTANAMISMGAADGESQWVFGAFAEDGVSTVDDFRTNVSDHCILAVTASGHSQSAEFVEFIEKGCTINWDVVSATARKGYVVFFTGNKVRAKVGTVLPTKVGATVTGVGFGPELLLLGTAFTAPGMGDGRAGIGTGFSIKGPPIRQRGMEGFFGIDGSLLSGSAPSFSTITRDTQSYTLVDMYTATLEGGIRCGVTTTAYSDDGFTLTAVNTLTEEKEVGWIALSFFGQAVLLDVDWNMSAQTDGLYTKSHGSFAIDFMVGLLAFPVASSDFGESASMGLFASDGGTHMSAISRGSNPASGSTNAVSVFSEGNIKYPSPLNGGTSLTISPQGWSDGGSGWTYILANAPQNDVRFRCLVIGRAGECYPTTWTQGQIMEIS